MAVVPAEAAKSATQRQPEQRVTEPGRLDVGRGPCRQLREEPADRANLPVELDVPLAVVRWNAPAIPAAVSLTSAENVKAVPSGDGAKREDLRRHEAHAVALEVEVTPDRRAQPADVVGQGRHVRTGCELGRRRGATDDVSPLEDERAHPAAGEVGRGDEAVVAAPDDDGVVALPAPFAPATQAAFRPRARSTSSAAIRPFAPMIPPPGWVAEPHSHRSRTGVRKRA